METTDKMFETEDALQIKAFTNPRLSASQSTYSKLYLLGIVTTYRETRINDSKSHNS